MRFQNHHRPALLTCGRTRHRSGLSLLEVLIAFVLLTGALAALGQRVFVGVKAATRLEDESEATLRCESVLAMVLSGVETQRSHGQCADDPAWLWTSEIRQSSIKGMLELTVTVHHSNPLRTTARCSLIRLIRDERSSPGKSRSRLAQGISP